MKRSLIITTMTLAVLFSASSCKKNWVCIHRYPSNSSDPNAPMVTSNVEITAKTRRDAKLECKAYAGPNDTWEIKAR